MGVRRLGLVLTAAVLLSSGCMTYRNIPVDRGPELAALPRAQGVLSYRIEGSAMFAGPSAVREVLANQAPYAQTSPAEREERRGDFLSVDIKQLPPTVAAVVFGYLSCATLTILPFWSREDGAVLTFTLYRDGQKVRAREYVINRSSFFWIGMLPLAWVNLFTPSEKEAFAAAARDFLASAAAR